MIVLHVAFTSGFLLHPRIYESRAPSRGHGNEDGAQTVKLVDDFMPENRQLAC